MNSAREFSEALRAIPYGEKGSEDRERYDERQSEIIGAFMVWLANEYASEFTPAQQGAIYGKAWSDGHSSGLEEVESYYIDLVDFARKFV